jgi:hypothetical protein
LNTTRKHRKALGHLLGVPMIAGFSKPLCCDTCIPEAVIGRAGCANAILSMPQKAPLHLPFMGLMAHFHAFLSPESCDIPVVLQYMYTMGAVQAQWQ